MVSVLFKQTRNSQWVHQLSIYAGSCDAKVLVCAAALLSAGGRGAGKAP